MNEKSSTFFCAGGAALTSHRDDWRTPPDLFAALNAEFGFTLDAAANAALTVEAVNNIDRLRDLVRMMEKHLRYIVESERPYDAVALTILREARAAIGEEV